MAGAFFVALAAIASGATFGATTGGITATGADTYTGSGATGLGVGMTAASVANASIDLVGGLFLADFLGTSATTLAFYYLVYSATSSSAFLALYTFMADS